MKTALQRLHTSRRDSESSIIPCTRPSTCFVSAPRVITWEARYSLLNVGRVDFLAHLILSDILIATFDHCHRLRTRGQFTPCFLPFRLKNEVLSLHLLTRYLFLTYSTADFTIYQSPRLLQLCQGRAEIAAPESSNPEIFRLSLATSSRRIAKISYCW